MPLGPWLAAASSPDCSCLRNEPGVLVNDATFDFDNVIVGVFATLPCSGDPSGLMLVGGARVGGPVLMPHCIQPFAVGGDCFFLRLVQLGLQVLGLMHLDRCARAGDHSG